MTGATDYCIIGAGPAGCILASRLTEDPDVTVTLLEAGPADWHPWVHVPAACLFLQHDRRFNWLDETVPQPNLHDRKIRVPQGRLLGGSGSINGMLHVRPQRADVDAWNTSGWSYEDLLPAMIRAEDFSARGPQRGQGGPHPVSLFTETHPLTQAFIDACGTSGIASNPDMNGPDRQGVAPFQQNRRGRFRAQAAQTYLRRARKRANLRIITGATCRQVAFEGTTAVGVRYDRAGQAHRLKVRREVLLCAGALRSPQILQVSGIGDPDHLARIGVAPVVSSEQVGRNLRDHFLVRVSHRVRGMTTINERAHGMAAVREALTYALRGRGALTMGAGAAAAILPSGLSGEVPDIQLSFAPGSFAGPGRLEREPGMTIGGWVSPGRSRGSVMAPSASTADRPLIDPNYLSDPFDREGIVACIRMIRSIFAQPALARWSVAETFPGAATGDDFDGLLDFARRQGASAYHFAGTCRMGDDTASVVDARLRVRGARNLRVIDASVMPLPPIGNAHASVVAVAERAASLIAEEVRLRTDATAQP